MLQAIRFEQPDPEANAQKGRREEAVEACDHLEATDGGQQNRVPVASTGEEPTGQKQCKDCPSGVHFGDPEQKVDAHGVQAVEKSGGDPGCNASRPLDNQEVEGESREKKHRGHDEVVGQDGIAADRQGGDSVEAKRDARRRKRQGVRGGRAVFGLEEAHGAGREHPGIARCEPCIEGQVGAP